MAVVTGPGWSDRLMLREFVRDDIPALTQILSDAEVMRYSVHGVLSEQETAGFVDACTRSYRERGFGPWAVMDKSTSTLAGFCGLNAEYVDGADEVELGYRLGRGFWGRGLGTDAARLTLAHGFEALKLDSVIAIVEPANLASLKVIGKLGFNRFVHSQYHRRSVKIYRMTAQQWSLACPT